MEKITKMKREIVEIGKEVALCTDPGNFCRRNVLKTKAKNIEDRIEKVLHVLL
jgi:hypothetical protein